MTTQPEAILEPGAVVDTYRVSRHIGSGGMGEVYLARDITLGRKVALKLIRSEALRRDSALRRFIQEARITAKFNHPGIVAIYGAGSYAGYPYVALEYVEGVTLKKRLIEGDVAPLEAARIGQAICEALAEAHRHGVLHRDLKPANVMLAADGRLKVLDFGIAKLLSAEPERADEDATEGDAADPEGEEPATVAGAAMGTPRYMAPEQWRGEACSPATDMWALGVVLFELLAGEHPFGVRDRDAYEPAVCSGATPTPLASVRSVPAPLGELVGRCLQHDPAARPSAESAARTLSALLRQEPELPTQEQSPFRGLLPFSERHSQVFFGRDDEIGLFLERLREVPVMPVVGPSGGGKSSFLKAGVIPRLRARGRWLVLELRPGRQPIAALEARLQRGEATLSARSASASASGLGASLALDATIPDRPATTGAAPQVRPPGDVASAIAQLGEHPQALAALLQDLAAREGAKILLFVDQMEELYTLCPDEEERRTFMRAVCCAADDAEGPVRVMFTLRDDFLGRAAETREARHAFEHITVLRSPDPEALLEILTRPLEAVGYAYDDPRLAAEMVEAVRGEPASLPLLQFACSVLWSRRDRDRRRLTREAYEAMGGVVGALARHADQAIAGFTPAQVRTAQGLLLRLITPEGARRSLERAALVDGLGDEAEPVLRRLIEARAVVVRRARDGGADRAEIELVHEAMIRHWDLLRRWLDERREELVFLADAAQAASAWERHGARADETWQGAALDEALLRAARCRALPDPVARFLEAGRRRKALRTRRRAIVVASSIGLLTIVALALAAAAYEARQQRERAEASQARAERQRALAEAQRAEAQREGAWAAFERGELYEARAKLRASLETLDSTRARGLWWRLTEEPLLWKRLLSNCTVADLDIAPDGSTIAVSCGDSVRSLDVRGPMAGVGVLATADGPWLRGATFSPDGARLALSTVSGLVEIRELGREGRARLPGHTNEVRVLRFSPDGRRVASASHDRTVRIHDVDGSRPGVVLRGHENTVWNVAFSPDGGTVASASHDGTVRLWDAATGRELLVLRGHDGPVRGVAFDPTGGLLASAGADGTVQIWDTATGARRHVLRGHADWVRAVAFSPDGTLLASASHDKTVRVWSTSTFEPDGEPLPHRAEVRDLSFSTDGRLLASVDSEGEVRLWSVAALARRRLRSGPTPLTSVGAGHGLWTQALAFNPDGTRLATGAHDATVRIWDVHTGEQLRVLRGHTGRVSSASFAPDGRRLASASYDKTVRIWDLDDGTEERVLVGHDAMIEWVTYSPDGRQLASASTDMTIRLWDAVTGAELRVLGGHRGFVYAVDYSPDGRTLVSGGHDQTVRLWDVLTGRELHELAGAGALIAGVSFSSDGRTIAAGSEDERLLRLWDLPSLEPRDIHLEGGAGWYPTFDPAGDRIGVGSLDGTAAVHSLVDHGTVLLEGHRGVVDRLQFSPDGALAATTGADGTLRLWEPATGRPVWRAPIVLEDPLRILSHLGWTSLETGAPVERPPTEWARALELRARAADIDASSGTLCMATFDRRLELWDVASDARLVELPLPRLERVIAAGAGCLALAGGRVSIVGRNGAERELVADGATALEAAGGSILVAAGARALVFDAAGTQAVEHVLDQAATAFSLVGPWLASGTREGDVALRDVDVAAGRSALALERAPGSWVTRLAAGPRGTIVAGFANGGVGVWSLDDGALLRYLQLHGSVAHLLVRDHSLVAATDLGQYAVLDLSVFDRDECDLLREVWREVPAVWAEGRPRLTTPPADHHCAPRRDP